MHVCIHVYVCACVYVCVSMCTLCEIVRMMLYVIVLIILTGRLPNIANILVALDDPGIFSFRARAVEESPRRSAFGRASSSKCDIICDIVDVITY